MMSGHGDVQGKRCPKRAEQSTHHDLIATTLKWRRNLECGGTRIQGKSHALSPELGSIVRIAGDSMEGPNP